MVKIKVLKTHKDKSGMNWVILESLTDGCYLHTLGRTDEDLKAGDEWDVPSDGFNFLDWAEFQSVRSKADIKTNFLKTEVSKGYSINSKINFGLYEGYQLGLVYAFDPTYLEWCIDNIETFYINDLEQLQSFGVFKVMEGYSMHREAGIPNFYSIIGLCCMAPAG